MSNIVEVTPGKYYYNFSEEEKNYMSPEITSKFGTRIKGQFITVGLYGKEKGTGSQPHRHPATEQFTYVIKGKLKAMVEGQEQIVGPGELIYIPANALHSIVASTDKDEEDVLTFECKVVAGCENNVPEDRKFSGPRFEPGFENKAKKIINSKK